MAYLFHQPQWGRAKGYTPFIRGEVISTNYNRALVLDENNRLWSVRFKYGNPTYPGDSIVFKGYAKGSRVYIKHYNISRSFFQKIRVSVHSFLKERFLNAVRDKFARKLGSALIFGENWFSKRERTKISHLGIYHLIVISGMHYALFLTFFLFIPVRWRLRWLIALLFFGFFTLFVLFPKAPAYRAFISVALFLLAFLFEKPYNALKALLLAYAVSLLLYPHWLFNFGFWLSYLASLSLILYFGTRKTPEEDYFVNFLSKSLGIEASLVVMVTISPILIYYLKYISFGTFLYSFAFTVITEVYLLIATLNLLSLWSIPPAVDLQIMVSKVFEYLYRIFPENVYVKTASIPKWEMYLFIFISLAILISPLSKVKKWLLLLVLFVLELVTFVGLNRLEI